MPLVATGFGDRDTGGGAFVVGPDEVERLDWLATTGLAIAPDGTRAARLIRADVAAQGAGSELLVYDARGVRRYARLDALDDPHDVAWLQDGSAALAVVATSANAVLMLDDAGEVVERWTPPTGTGDAWHLNCLLVDDGRLLVCAFGRFAEHRGWADPGASDGAGEIFDLRTGATVLGGLTRPHHPRRLGDGSWLLCDSGRGAVQRLDGAGRLLGEAVLGGFTRGLAVDDALAYVGVNPGRGAPSTGTETATARVVALGLDDLRERWTAVLPCREVYDVTVTPAPLVDGMRRGFRTNAARVADEDQLALLRSVGAAPAQLWSNEPLAPESCRVRVVLEDVPELLTGPATVRWRAENLGDVVLASGGAHPVSLSWRWVSSDGVTEGSRVPLRPSLAPGGEISGTATLAPPPGAGPLELRCSLVQEGVRWFDDLDEANGWHAVIHRG